MTDVRLESRNVSRSALASAMLALATTGALAAAPPVATPGARLREQDVPRYEPVSATELAVGRIEIPRVGVSSVILQGVDYKTIRRAVGHFPESPMPHENGNMALAAHRTTDFAGLRDIRIGDEIAVITPRGTFRYVVDRTLVVDPKDVWVLDPSAERELTLVTCYPFDFKGSAPNRLIVRALAAPADAADDAVATAIAHSPAVAVPTSASN